MNDASLKPNFLKPKVARFKLFRLRQQYRALKDLETRYCREASRVLQQIAVTRQLMRENGISEE